MTCPDDETLSAFTRDHTSGPLAAHVASCELCQAALAGLATHATTSSPSSTREQIGRYDVESTLGMGGMGIVFRAKDRELGRAVAIKLVHTSAADGDERLLREAKAMAALQHPNVVTLYDFGEHEGDVYLAMELVTQTLREWLAATPRTWRQVTAAFEQAARGLHAAHELGIVHRDFKPDNVFIGDDGRVRVGDFGLARAAGDDDPLVVMGTLRYMAPEQLAGRGADARSDQFAFCVAFYEALCAALPYGDGPIAALRSAYDAARPPAFPSRVPRWLQRVIARGLQIDPAPRYDSMAELIDALSSAPARRKRWLIGGAVLTAVAASSAGAFLLGHDRSAADPCAGGGPLLAATYGGDAEAALGARFAASSSPYIRDMAPRLFDRLRAYTARWLAMHGDTCRATVVNGAQSAELMDLKMACLDERLREVNALVTTLRGATDDGLKLAVEAAGKLSPLDACGDERALRAELTQPPLPGTRASIEMVREHLRRAKFAEATGDYKQSLAIAQTALEIATNADYAPVKAEALFQVGLALTRLERGAEASEHLHRAATTAEAAHDDDIAAQARVALVMNLGLREGKFDEAERMGDYAAAAIERDGARPQLRADLLLNRAANLNRTGKPDLALPLSLEALAVLEASKSSDDLQLGRVNNRIGNDLVNVGRFGDALPYFDKAFDAYVRAVGDNHPHVANVLTNRGGALRYLGRYDDALALQQRALAIREHAFGPDHPEVAAALTNISNTLHGMGKREEAFAMRKRALAIAQAKLPSSHSNLIVMRLNVLDSMMQLHHDKEAAELCDAQLPTERTERPALSTTSRWMAACAVPYLRTGRAAFAWDVYRTAAADIAKRKELISEDYLVPFAQEVLWQGQPAAARPLLERAYRYSSEVSGPNDPETIELGKLVEQAKRGAR